MALCAAVHYHCVSLAVARPVSDVIATSIQAPHTS